MSKRSCCSSGVRYLFTVFSIPPVAASRLGMLRGGRSCSPARTPTGALLQEDEVALAAASEAAAVAAAAAAAAGTRRSCLGSRAVTLRGPASEADA